MSRYECYLNLTRFLDSSEFFLFSINSIYKIKIILYFRERERERERDFTIDENSLEVSSVLISLKCDLNSFFLK